MNDDMDDLFRKAAEQYPLKSDAGNFDAVQKQLQHEAVAASVNVVQKSRFNKRWLLLLLLLPLPFVCTRFENAPVDTTVVSPVKNDASAATDEKATNKHDVATNENNDVLIDGNNNVNSKTGEINNVASDKVLMDKKATSSNGVARLKLLNSKQLAQVNKVFQDVHDALHREDELVKKDNATTNAIVDATDSNSIATTSADTKTAVTADTVQASESNKKSVADKSSKKNNLVQKGLYAGLLAGIDASTIKYQAIKDKGFSLGLLAGYKFNKVLSVETGVFWDRKKYYSDGKYFDKTRSGIGPDVYVVYLDGYCNMFEIPTNIKLDFLQTANSNFFATTGLSSYIMKKEKYNYLGSVNGWDYEGTHQYKNATNNWFGVMNFSAGFQHKVFNSTNIRMESYYKLPLSGLGIGRMSITSFGFNIGLTHPLK